MFINVSSEADGRNGTNGADLLAICRLRLRGSLQFLLTAKDLERPCDYQYMTGKLTNRQAEVLRLVAEGLTDRQIAERLCISPRTAGTHVRNAMAALGAVTRANAVYLSYVVVNCGRGSACDG